MRVSIEQSVPLQVQTAPVYTSPQIWIPGISTSPAYTAADAVGTRFEVPVGGASGYLQAVLLTDLAKQSAALWLLLFRADFVTGTDNAAFDLLDQDRAKYVGYVTIAASDYVGLNDSSVAMVKQVNLGFTAPRERLYVQAVTNGTPTYASTDDLYVQFVTLPDARWER